MKSSFLSGVGEDAARLADHIAMRRDRVAEGLSGTSAFGGKADTRGQALMSAFDPKPT